MALKIKKYNVLVYEPMNVADGLRIGESVLKDLDNRANAMCSDLIIRELVSSHIIGAKISIDELIKRAHEIPLPIAKKIEAAIPEEERFSINTAPYEKLGHMPCVLGELAEVYMQMVPEGIDVTFFNTAVPSGSPRNDYRRLAEIMHEFPAIYKSTWVITDSLRQPMPAEFFDLITERRGGIPNGKAEVSNAIISGSPCKIPLGDSMVLAAQANAVKVIYDRLKSIRRIEP